MPTGKSTSASCFETHKGHSSARKRICVGFRGSVTTRDFMVDGKAYITEYQNPLAPDDPSNTIGIHHGFHGTCDSLPLDCYSSFECLSSWSVSECVQQRKITCLGRAAGRERVVKPMIAKPM